MRHGQMWIRGPARNVDISGDFVPVQVEIRRSGSICITQTYTGLSSLLANMSMPITLPFRDCL